jgi:hypothetical protein
VLQLALQARRESQTWEKAATLLPGSYWTRGDFGVNQKGWIPYVQGLLASK